MIERDKTIPLGDQCNNPGSMYYGAFARRFGSTQTYQMSKHNCAIFPTPAHGSAALCELILNRKGLTLREYLMGGDTLPPEKSYSGGADYNSYMGAMSLQSNRLTPTTILAQSEVLLVAMINAHSYAEGNWFRMTDAYFSLVKKLLIKSSKVWIS